MIAYTGHPEYDFVYECRIRGPHLGYFVGIHKDFHGEFVLPENHTPRLQPLLDSLHPIDSDGLGIDGDGVFHGTPKGRVFVTVTKDCDEVFGKYPENLKEKPQGDDALRQLRLTKIKLQLDELEFRASTRQAVPCMELKHDILSLVKEIAK